MYPIIITIHVIVCVLMVLVVLLQQGKGAEIGAVFGSSEALFGSAGPATFLSKMTTILAVLFMVTSLSLSYMAAHRTSGSVMEDVGAVKTIPTQTAPPAAVPAPVPAPAAPANDEVPSTGK